MVRGRTHSRGITQAGFDGRQAHPSEIHRVRAPGQARFANLGYILEENGKPIQRLASISDGKGSRVRAMLPDQCKETRLARPQQCLSVGTGERALAVTVHQDLDCSTVKRRRN